MVKLTAPQTYRVVKTVLEGQLNYQSEIVRKANVSRTQVSHIATSLEDLGIISQQGKARLKLLDPYKLLDAISYERPLKRLLVREFRTEASEPTAVEKLVRNTAVHRGYSYALTCFSALSKYIEYYITYPTVHIYSSSADELSTSFEYGGGMTSVQVLRPDNQAIMESILSAGDYFMVDPIQTVIDLFCLGEYGRDGAIKLYEAIKNGAISASKSIVR